MIGIAIRTFIIDFGLNIMFDRIINNFNTMPLMERIQKDPEYMMSGESVKLYFLNGEIIRCLYNRNKEIDGINYLCCYFPSGIYMNYKACDIKMMERLDFNSTYTADGYLDIDDEENITDEQIIGWLKEKRDD